MYGPAADADGLARLRRRWDGSSTSCEADDGRTGPGAVLIRPDGHVSFRANASDASALAAIDEHLGSYLIAA